MAQPLGKHPEVEKLKQEHMLKIVTGSFYKELIKYGVDNSDIVSVSMNLLDYVTDTKNSITNERYKHFNFTYSDVKNNWLKDQSLAIREISIKPLQNENAILEQVRNWLQADEIKNTFIDYLPKSTESLQSYFFNSSDKEYFGIYKDGNEIIGIIGAERIDSNFNKLEMKKYVAIDKYRGKGYGKAATFLFLYHTFNIRKFNKVFIHSIDTNIKNINLNSHFGFSLEGLFLGEAVINQQYHDVLRMGLVREKWLDIFALNTK